MRTTDNNGGKSIDRFDNLNIADLSAIANRSILDLQNENPDLLVFPHLFCKHQDNIEKTHIFSLDNENLTTYNLMGFIGRNTTQLTISSRFAKDDNQDYFLHYMLQKVFSINLLKFDQTPNKENIWDFLFYLFPHYLKKAYSQGIYKTYKKEEHNNTNVKGSIDIKRHILRNIPFKGNIAYTTKEHSYNNNLTQLIRHTIEYIRTHPYGSGVLTSDSELRDIVSKFIFLTNKTYNSNSRQKVITANLKPVTHPYFTEYPALQKICLKILRHEKITFGKEKDKVYGLLFDGAWLWEEYLNTILKENFIHPENKTGKNKHLLFENFQPIYPDFISKKEPKSVGDAKYIPLDRQQSYSEKSEKSTSIYYKTITYMYRFSSKNGFLIFPKQDISFFETYRIKETDGTLKKLGLAIPQTAENFKEYMKTMNRNEEELRQQLMTNKTPNPLQR
ncbi:MULTISPECIES: McrC family protein [unclassified Chryseobacterium]|uniref:McrC family protein n=1 Tax=unclassified Chryseobacterium TaxID=2593645 RepID=UPI000D3D9BFE|nr:MULTISPECIES: restriction endonuclease [unclassified Chryseobacterium]PTT66913.1 restriction endonuclease [Chryseobacterium sp. HMWF001]PVV57216.1 restriction endonuclease [Chryseobacterium sp. HMWF035]